MSARHYRPCILGEQCWVGLAHPASVAPHRSSLAPVSRLRVAISFDPLMDSACTFFLVEAWRAEPLATIRLDKYCPTRFVLTPPHDPAIYGVRQVPVGGLHKCREGEGCTIFSIDIVQRPADL